MVHAMIPWLVASVVGALLCILPLNVLTHRRAMEGHLVIVWKLRMGPRHEAGAGRVTRNCEHATHGLSAHSDALTNFSGSDPEARRELGIKRG